MVRKLLTEAASRGSRSRLAALLRGGSSGEELNPCMNGLEKGSGWLNGNVQACHVASKAHQARGIQFDWLRS